MSKTHQQVLLGNIKANQWPQDYNYPSSDNMLVATTNAEKANIIGTKTSQSVSIQLYCSYHKMNMTCLLESVSQSPTAPDNITGLMIKSTSCSIASAVTAIFSQTVRQGKIPVCWKTARVTPVPKTCDHMKLKTITQFLSTYP